MTEQPNTAPKVKPLEWESIYNLGTLEQSKTSIGIYTISDDEDKSFGTFVYLHLTPEGDCTKYGLQVLKSGPYEVDEAKAAAQADYERRILSALDMAPTTPAQAAEVLEPVAGKIAQIMDVPDCSNDLVHHELQVALKAIAEEG